jgi:hypothetical protein
MNKRTIRKHARINLRYFRKLHEANWKSWDLSYYGKQVLFADPARYLRDFPSSIGWREPTMKELLG